MPILLVLLVYNLFFPFLLLALAPKALRKMRQRGGQWSDLWQRFGWFTEEVRTRVSRLRERGPLIWIHAVSVGEVGIAEKLVQELRRRQPSLGIVLTTTTPTGHKEALSWSAKISEGFCVLYNPLDGWWIVRRYLSLLSPSQVILVESEIWPNLLYAAHRRQIPVVLVNARLSPRSERRYRGAAAIVQPIFQMLHRVLAQEPEDVARWTGLGVPASSVTATGSIKFDTQGVNEPVQKVARFRTLLNEIGCTSDRSILLAASTHEGEEVEIARLFLRLRDRHPGLFLVIVPRHVERSARLEAELAGLGLRVLRRTALDSTPVAEPSADTLLVDTTGELRAWQYLASLVVVGKSFTSKGGQNPAEAVVAGKPVLFGPHMDNFEALVRLLLAHKGAVQVPTFAELEAAIDRLLQNPQKALTLSTAGQKALEPHRGATHRTADLLALA